jgi:hypothetical protein
VSALGVCAFEKIKKRASACRFDRDGKSALRGATLIETSVSIPDIPTHLRVTCAYATCFGIECFGIEMRSQGFFKVSFTVFGELASTLGKPLCAPR